jgi:hypothetical protein
MTNKAGQAIVVGLAAACLCYLYGLGFSWRVVAVASVAEVVRSAVRGDSKTLKAFDGRVTLHGYCDRKDSRNVQCQDGETQ